MEQEQIEHLVNQQINKNEKLGSRSGGSGHMGHTSYRIDEINTRKLEDDKTEISYTYTLMVETEFTYYPDNPPYEFKNSGIIIVDKEGTVS